jgi:hypothetical protein
VLALVGAFNLIAALLEWRRERAKLLHRRS